MGRCEKRFSVTLLLTYFLRVNSNSTEKTTIIVSLPNSTPDGDTTESVTDFELFNNDNTTIIVNKNLSTSYDSTAATEDFDNADNVSFVAGETTTKETFTVGPKWNKSPLILATKNGSNENSLFTNAITVETALFSMGNSTSVTVPVRTITTTMDSSSATKSSLPQGFEAGIGATVSCQDLKCQHSAKCLLDNSSVPYCDCGLWYSGHLCESGLPLYLLIGLVSSVAFSVLFCILFCAIMIKRKKISPNQNGAIVHNNDTKENGHHNNHSTPIVESLFTVDERIYADPTDFYGGESVKGDPLSVTTNTLPKIPRISGVPKLRMQDENNMEVVRNGSCDNNDLYRTFQPKRREKQTTTQG